MKGRIFSFILLVSLSSSFQLFAQAFKTADYTKALWMTCRFYGCQRSSTISKTPTNWLLLDHAYNGNKGFDFYLDADNGYSVAGGWSDCGDNVRFGQTQYYSAYVLLKGYDLWPNGYGDYYSPNYAGYEAGEDFTWEGGYHDPDGIPDVLNEVKYATDYFIRCTPNSKTFYYQVGDGQPDHNMWITTVRKETETTANGGEPRSVYKNPADASMASFCGATLALMSRKYSKYDAAYADTCLAHALLAYAYAKANPGTVGDANGGSFYGGNAKWQDDYATLCTELYYATNNASYKTEALSYAGNLSNHNYCFDYHDNDDIAAYNLATLGSTASATLLDQFASMYKGNVDGNGIYQGGNTTWGPLRYNANSAFVIALDNLYHGTTTVDQFIYKQIDFIMGNNTITSQTVTSNLSFIVGDGTNTCHHPHHRNIYSDDNNVANSAVLEIPSRNAQFGYLVGGVRSGSYDDTRNDYQVCEGGIDYSACLVGVLAYILAETVTATPTGVTVSPKPIAVPISSTAKATATVTPTNAPQTVTWTSSNSSVATVNSSGLITGIAVGTAYIAAKTGTFRDSTLATVSKISVTGVKVSPTTLSIIVGNTGLLSDSLSPANPSNKSVVWTSSDTTVAQVSSSGLVTGIAVGTATITVTTADGSFKASSTITVVSDPTVLLAYQTTTAPTIDGNLNESFWNLNKPIAKVTTGTLNNTETFAVVWDNTNLYIAVKVIDATITTTNANPYDNDAIELYFDMDHTSGAYDATCFQWIKVEGSTSIWQKLGTAAGGTTTTSQVKSASQLITGGYTMEFAIPWSLLGVTPSTTAKYGFDIGVDDCDGTTSRSNQAVWAGDGNDYQSTGSFGTLELSSQPVGTITQTVSLAKGWNLISFNVVPTDSTVATVFGGVMSNVSEIKNADGFYSTTNASTAFNSLSSITQGKGYLVKMKATSTLSVAGVPSTCTATKLQASLKTGWNLTGCPFQSTTAIATAYDITKISMIKSFDGFYVPNGTTNTLTSIVPNKGYFVKK